MAGTPRGLRDDWHSFLREDGIRRIGQQFGTSDDESTFNGATGCMHTKLRILIRAVTGRDYSHDEISKVAGYPWPANNPNRRGLRLSTDPDSEVMRVVRKFGLPYVPYFYDGVLTDRLWERVKTNMRESPLIIGMKYSHYPEDKGYVYMGRRADGYPVGFALAHGKTQLSGAENIAHAVMLIAYWESTKYDRWVVSSKDPNHGSPSRPERPPFDLVTPTQTKKMINSLRQLTLRPGEPRSLTFLFPTRTITPR